MTTHTIEFMNWGDVATWASTAIALVATGVAIWQAVLARRAAQGAEKSEDASLDAANRSAAAAERSAQSASRAADAEEQAAAAARDSAQAHDRIASVLEQQAARYEPPWVVQHHSGSTFVLINDGDEPTLDVRADTDSVTRPSTTVDEVPPGSAVQFWYVGHMGSSPFITVTWLRPGETERRQWRGAIPKSPK